MLRAKRVDGRRFRWLVACFADDVVVHEHGSDGAAVREARKLEDKGTEYEVLDLEGRVLFCSRNLGSASGDIGCVRMSPWTAPGRWVGVALPSDKPGDRSGFAFAGL